MGVLLDELLSEIKSKEIDQQVKEICDTIWNQEKDNINNDYIKFMPVGPNIFLALSCKGRNKDEIGFLTLEREFPGEYVIGLYATILYPPGAVIPPTYKGIRRYRTWPVKEINSKRIIKAYAEMLKYVNGE